MAYMNGNPYTGKPEIDTIVCNECYEEYGAWTSFKLTNRQSGEVETHWQQASPWCWSPRWSFHPTVCAWGVDGHLVETPRPELV